MNILVTIPIIRLGIFHVQINIKGITTFEYLYSLKKEKKNLNKVEIKKSEKSINEEDSSKKSINDDKMQIKEENIEKEKVSFSMGNIENLTSTNNVLNDYDELEKKNKSLIKQKSKKDMKSSKNLLKNSLSEAGLNFQKKKKSTRAIMDSPEQKKLINFSEKFRISKRENIRKLEEDNEEDLTFPRKYGKSDSDLSKGSEILRNFESENDFGEFEEI